MAVAYYGSRISEHLAKTPEGYLVCYAVPINRTGTQLYSAGELGLDGDPERAVTVYRLADDVFAPAALASLEGKDVTRGHPAEMLDAGNQAAYSKGHMENVRRDGENTVADLIIKDPALISDVENGVLREVSCGYNCQFEPYLDGYRQTHILGNHVAIVPRGRAGRDVAIKDTAGQAEKGRKHMSDFWRSVLTAFGMAAKEASPEELDGLIETTATVLDAEPAAKAQDAEPTEKAGDMAVEPQEDAMGAKLDRILELLEAQARSTGEEQPLHDEKDLDEVIMELTGEEKAEEAAISGEEGGGMTGPARDAAVELLRKVRPAVAAIEDRSVRAKVTDALLSAVKGPDEMGTIARAAMDSAQANARKNRKATYEQMCAEAESAYAARNPHKNDFKEDN